MMHSTTQQKPQSTVMTSTWLRRIGVTGFIFFLVKGLAWIIFATWVVY